MPFTGSHPAAVLPFLRTGLPASALVIGSMTPDLLYYVPLDVPFRTHTASAVIGTDLVLGLLAWLCWHGLLSPPLVATSPPALRARLAGRVRLGLRQRSSGLADVVRLVVALVLGAATHVLWDDFTHPGRWGAEHVGVLARSWAGEPGYAWAQDLSGLLGAIVLLIWSALWWRRTPPGPRPAGRVIGVGWLVVVTAGALAGLVAGLGQPDVRSAAAVAAFAGGGCAALTALVLAAGWWVRRWAADGVRRS